MCFDHRRELIDLAEISTHFAHAFGVDHEKSRISIQPKGFLTPEHGTYTVIRIVKTFGGSSPGFRSYLLRDLQILPEISMIGDDHQLGCDLIELQCRTITYPEGAGVTGLIVDARSSWSTWDSCRVQIFDRNSKGCRV